MELWITVLLLLGITLSGSETVLSPPEELYFLSVNTENILHWNPAQNNSQHVRYDVEYCRYGYGEDFIPVSNCTGISHHYCDLTEETWNLSISFQVRVRSVIGNTTSKWERSNRFKPYDATALGLPSFDVKIDHNKITVRVFPPTLHTAKRNRSMEDVFKDSMMYFIYIRGNGINESAEHRSSKEPYIKTEELLGSTYCIKVRAKLTGDERESNITEEKCVEIPTNPDEFQVVSSVIGTVFILIFICFCLRLVYHYYLKKQRTTPAVLKSFEKNKKFLNIRYYLSLTEDVVVQKVFAVDAHPGVTKTLEQDEPWLDQKIKEASSVDSGIDIGSQSSDRVVLLSEPLNRYMQQTPDSSSLQSTSPECGQSRSQPIDFSSVDIPDTTDEPGDNTGSINISGYQRQMPRTNMGQEPIVEDSLPCCISLSDISVTEELTRGFLNLDDVMLMENEF
ncbi:interleukin-20 receptor subunit alpha-like [Hypanus sabinus]|uniref:interleukin-20 receptor subunit alpha-like n=1 Tax=Hypanus sabinus TaxID=79690 RepID=UPI0028C3E169|nr:interleukin-20 receptor subunit alpha-like [Hypanus sabinus]